MTFGIFVVTCFLVFRIVDISAAPADIDCRVLPKNMETCCKMYDMDDHHIEKECMEKMAKEDSDIMRSCKLSSCLLKNSNVLKDGELHNDTIMNYMNLVKDPTWKGVLINASIECMTEVKKQKASIVKDFQKAPFDIQLKDCDVSHMVYLTCVHLESFANCPKVYWTNSTDCEYVNHYFEKCTDQWDSIKSSK